MKKLALSKLKILIAPAALILLFYILRRFRPIMDFTRPITSVLRNLIGFITSLLPFSLTEVGGTALGVFLIYYIVKTIIAATSRDAKGWRGEILLRRVTPVVMITGYAVAAFLWMWGALYVSTPFYRGILANEGVTVEDLIAAAEFFLDGANEHAASVPRDADGNFDETASALMRRANTALDFGRVREEFPALYAAPNIRAKPMIYSGVMTATGFTGMYFAPTGEAHINTQAPAVTMPTTIAHELVHSLGVAPEDEANFLAVVACVMSDDPSYKYSGYLSGLIYCANALFRASPVYMYSSSLLGSDEYYNLVARYSDLVRQDLNYIAEFWSRHRPAPPEDGVQSFSDAVDTFVAVMSDTVNDVYDGYLIAQGQELGMRSYGACVNLLSEWVKNKHVRRT